MCLWANLRSLLTMVSNDVQIYVYGRVHADKLSDKKLFQKTAIITINILDM